MGEVIDAFTWIARILFAVRVSVINVVSSGLLFWFAVQADDLLADLSFENGWQLLFWPGVFAATFFLWAFPVHYGARKTLDKDAWIIQSATRNGLPAHCRDAIIGEVRARYGGAIEWIPRVLGVMPFLVLAIGIWGAYGAIGRADVLPEIGRAQTQLLVLLVLDAAFAAAFVYFVIRRKDWFASWTSDALHRVALAGTGAIFVCAYVFPIHTALVLPRALLVPPLFGSLVLFTSWLQRLGNKTGFPFLAAIGVVAGVLTACNTNFDALRTSPQADKGTPSTDERLTVADAVARWKAANACSGDSCPHPIVVAIDGGASRAAFTAATFVGELLDNVPAAEGGEVPSPGRRLFAISGVSGGAYGAAVIQSALRDGQAAPSSGVAPCRSAQRTWFGYDEWTRQNKPTMSWRQCLQALTSGDYLSPTIVGLAFRDFAAPPWQDIGLPPLADRAALLELSWQRHYSATLSSQPISFLSGESCDGKTPEGLCRPAAHPAAFIEPGKTWMPMLFLSGTSVTTGRRIISADLKAVNDAASVDGGALYPQAYDLREAMSSPCPDVLPSVANGKNVAYPIKRLVDAANGKNVAYPDKRPEDAADKTPPENEQTLLLGSCGGRPAPVDGPDVRLSTAALISARFPVISPAGIFSTKARDNKGVGGSMDPQPYGDQVVDGGYFENSGITTALEVVKALRAQHLKPILVSISNNPQLPDATAADIAACAGESGTPPGGEELRLKLARHCSGVPPRTAPTPLLFTGFNAFVGRLVALAALPLKTLVGTGDGHADEAMGQAQAAFADGGLFWLKVDVAPSFGPLPGPAFGDDERCKKMTPNTRFAMSKVSMSWWLSAAVQADLDIQRCSIDNRSQLRDLVEAMKARNGVSH